MHGSVCHFVTGAFLSCLIHRNLHETARCSVTKGYFGCTSMSDHLLASNEPACCLGAGCCVSVFELTCTAVRLEAGNCMCMRESMLCVQLFAALRWGTVRVQCCSLL